MNPDYYVKRVELNTGDENEYPQTNPTVQSPSAPKPAKDFKKILGKSQKENREEMQKKKTPGKEFEDEAIGVKETKDDEENASDVASISPTSTPLPIPCSRNPSSLTQSPRSSARLP